MQTQTIEQRFVAPDMSRALRMLADEFGDDAVLLSSRPVPEGVEVIGLPPGAKPSTDDVNQLHTDRRKGDRRRVVRALESTDDSTKHAIPEVAVMPDERYAGTVDEHNDIRSAASQLAERIQGWSAPESQESLAAISQSLQQVQNLLSDNALKTSAAGVEQILPEPAQYVVMQRLVQAGLSMPVVRALVNTASGDSVQSLWQDCRQRLGHILPLADYALFDKNSVVAITGAKGSGKSELVAKVVASQAVEGNIKELAVICLSDSITAGTQRLSLLTGVALYQASNSESLAARLKQCKHYKRVLVDVDAEKIAELSAGELSIPELLMLPATGEKHYLQSVLAAYRQENTIGCAVSFYDKCAAKGDLMSALISEQLPLFYMSSGLLLPEHLIVPQREQLLESLLQHSTPASEAMIPTVNLHAKDATGQATG